MRTTLRVEDDVMAELQQRAQSEGTSLTQQVNRLLRIGLAASNEKRKPKRKFRQKTFSMGEPAIPINKALALASQMEDDEILGKLELRK